MAFPEQPWLHPIRWLREHPRAADLILAVAITAITLIGHLFADVAPDDVNSVDPAWWTIALVVVGAMPIYWRRTHPVGVALFVVATQVLALLIFVDGAAFIASSVAVYSLGAHSTGLRRTRTLVTIAAMVLLLFVAGWRDGHALVGEFVSTIIVLVTMLVLGDNMRRRREHLVDLAERAERAEREQELLAERRVAAERTRIARELHDVVAHSVSVMIIQAAAARRNMRNAPDDAERAIAAIESTGRQTMQELRAILGVLRTDDVADAPPLDPSPTLGDIGRLASIDELPIIVHVTGDIDELPSTVSLTGYRIVQEAVTNVRRHAGPVDSVDVNVHRSPSSLTITVADNGRGAAADVSSHRGYGLVGMAERVAVVGGSLVSGPRQGGGWEVRATIPLPSGCGDAPSATVADRDSRADYVELPA
jgi:signal transduction histidine kinase